MEASRRREPEPSEQTGTVIELRSRRPPAQSRVEQLARLLGQGILTRDEFAEQAARLGVRTRGTPA